SRGFGVLAPHEDVASLCPDAETSDGTSLDQCMRCPAEDFPVLERARLRFVGVAAEIVRLAVVLGHERPLHAAEEAGAATPAQSRGLDRLYDLLGGHGQRLGQRRVTAARRPTRQGPGLGVAEVLGEQRGLPGMMGMRVAHQGYRARSSATESTVTDSMKSSSISIGVT